MRLPRHNIPSKQGFHMQFKDLKVGQSACIISLTSENRPYRQRLIAMGLLPGTPFKVTRLAPLGDPIEISVRGFALSLRKNEAALIKIQVLA